MVYLVHHGEAVEPDVDSRRPLSARGRAGVDALALEASSRGVSAGVIWHSGKLRARQTAEAFWKMCNPMAEFSAARGLQPTDPPVEIVNRVTVESRDVMLVGHMPNIERVFRLMTTGHAEADLTFPLHGVVALEQEADRWHERWRLEGPV